MSRSSCLFSIRAVSILCLVACSREAQPLDSSQAATATVGEASAGPLDLKSAATWEVARARPVRVESDRAQIVVGYLARGNDIVCRHAEACRCEVPWPLSIKKPGKNKDELVRLVVNGEGLSCDPCTQICPVPPGPARLSGELDLAESVLRLDHLPTAPDGSKLEPARVEHPRGPRPDAVEPVQKD